MKYKVGQVGTYCGSFGSFQNGEAVEIIKTDNTEFPYFCRSLERDWTGRICRGNFKPIDMTELTVTKEKVLEAASKCPQAKEALQTIFPEAFEDDIDYNSLKKELVRLFDNEMQYKFFEKLPGSGAEGKAQFFIEQIKKHNS